MSDQESDQLQSQKDAMELQQWGTWIESELARGQAPEQITASMVQQGWSLEEANSSVTAINQKIQNSARNAAFLRDAVRRAAQAKHGRNIFLGGLWFAGGLIVTVGSYLSATSSREGGRYLVAWGAVIFGGLQLLGGLVGYFRTGKNS